MLTFFDYRSPYRTDNFIQLNIVEKTIPFIILFLMIYVIYKYKDQIRNNPKLDRDIRLYGGIAFTIFYLSHYFLRFLIYGFDSILLPFQLCSISMFLAILLLFTKNRTIFAFTFFAGILGAFVSYITPVLGYDSGYYRYYQFYIAHGLLILTPIYFYLVHHYVPTLKETISAYLILNGLALFMGIYNYFNGTDFMFIFVDPVKEQKFPIISKFGGVPYYIIFMEVVAVAAFGAAYYLVNKRSNRYK